MLSLVQSLILLQCSFDFCCFISVFTDTFRGIGAFYTDMLQSPDTDPLSPERHFFNDTISFFLLEWCAVRASCVFSAHLHFILVSYVIEIIMLFNTLQYSRAHLRNCVLMISYCILVSVVILIELH